MDISSVNNYSPNLTAAQIKQRKEATQDVAAGVGATGITATATRYAGKQGVLQRMFTNVQEVTKVTSKNSREITGLWSKFMHNTKLFTNDIMSKFTKFKGNKLIAPIIESPLAKGASKIFGATMAFFVLVTGVQKAFDNGRLAVGDLKDKLNIAA